MFTLTPLMNGGVLVEGTDVTGKTGTTILLSDKWDMFKSVRAHEAATAEFAEVVDEFFKPLTEAADRAEEIAHPKKHDWSMVTISEATEGVEAQVIELDMDGTILRLLEAGDGSMLRWVGNDTLVVIAP